MLLTARCWSLLGLWFLFRGLLGGLSLGSFWFLFWLLLGSSRVEGALDKRWDIIIVFFTFLLWFGTLCLLTNEVFQEFVLLRADVSEDLWHQIFEFFGLTGSSNDKEVFTNGELDYTGRNEPTEQLKDIDSVQKPIFKACYRA